MSINSNWLIKRLKSLKCVTVLTLVAYGFVPAWAQGADKGQSVTTAPQEKPRIIVLTDIANEPDDSESVVRLLVYANEFDVEGLIATTSVWLKTSVHPEMIEERVRAYGQVLPNLRQHAAGYPDAQALLSRIRAGRAEYGMQGVGEGKESSASQLIISVVDRADPRPVWISIWSGATDLAQALWQVRKTRTPAQLAAFIAKLRVYSISDQDDAGPWIRANFPELFWIASIHAFGEYSQATWTGISGDLMRPMPGADKSFVTREWLAQHIQKGLLGALYPTPQYIMEGDTPSFLYLIPNGLNVPEHPEYGGWGGRYGKVATAIGLYANTSDSVLGVDGNRYQTAQATIWRWRAAFQNDFAARMQWTLQASYAMANHHPLLVVNEVAGRNPVTLSVCAGTRVRLSTIGSSDPDQNALNYHWWQYKEPSGIPGLVDLNIENATSPVAEFIAPSALDKRVLHIILEVRDDGSPPLTSYRRVLVNVLPRGTSNPGQTCAPE